MFCARLGVTQGLAPARAVCGGGELSGASLRVFCLYITSAVYQHRPDQYFKNLLAAIIFFFNLHTETFSVLHQLAT